jgi:hypothetical protein
MQLSFGERARLARCSVRLAPNIGGVTITKRWIGFMRSCVPRGATHRERRARSAFPTSSFRSLNHAPIFSTTRKRALPLIIRS